MIRFLAHSGKPQPFIDSPIGSGRYRRGTGEDPFQHAKGFNGYVNELKKQGLTEKEIAIGLGYKSTGDLRAAQTIEGEKFKEAQRMKLVNLVEKGYSVNAAAKHMNIPESTARNYLKPIEEQKANTTRLLADRLKKEVADKKYLDVGAGVERQLGISKEKLSTGIKVLEQEGYKLQYFRVEQATNPGKLTSVKVLTKDDVPYNILVKNRDKISSPDGFYFENTGNTLRNIKPPVSISSDRIKIRYAEDGGNKKDGVIEIKPGVEDLAIGQNSYAQVRIAVDGTHYLKGMAMYSDSVPKGYDIVFNTNKKSDVPKMDVLKTLETDKDNPFKTTVRQFDYEGKDGKTHQSPINLVNEDKDWAHWSKNLAAQFLSKQSPILAERQLNLDVSSKKSDLETIKSLTNPVVKKQLLKDFAEDCDAAAVDLKASALPRQATHVILPLTTIKDNEVYAPNYRNGEEVVLIRYPHGGIFEIPRLKVNNNNKEGKSLLKDARTAIGINSNVAEKLSGADFDGDTVVVIPTANQKIKTMDSLEALKNFDPNIYANPKGNKQLETSKENGFNKGTEMGKVSNLITDMTIKGATYSEIARAVKHSMVVIDAEKHNLNWRQSALDNNIAELKVKYQGGANRGASTIISRSSSDYRIPEIKDFVYSKNSINPKTGEKIYEKTGRTYLKKGPVRKDGTQSEKEIPYTTKTTKMAAEKDANALLSDNPMPIEKKYATYANQMKSLANEARLEWLNVKPTKINPSAKKLYKEELDSLNQKLIKAELNAPRERQAQLIADKIVKQKFKDNPNLSKDEQKKVRAQTITEIRIRTGASGKENRIHLSDKEWEAIQSGAVSSSKLESIVRYSDLDELKEKATPRDVKGITPAKLSRAKSLINAGYTQAEIADLLGVSVSTVNKALN